ncbi:MAG: TetR/AcrR family transcriptional regulator [Chloroflexota bacterium]
MDHRSPDHAPDPRRRDAATHAAILRATVELLENRGYRALTIEGVARHAGVGKQTIYRWWGGSKAALVLEAFTQASDERVEPPDTGSVRGDLLAILVPVFALSADRASRTALANRTMMAEAQLDPAFHEQYVALHRHWWGPLDTAIRRGIARGELAAGTDPGQAIDLLLGFAWYRLLLGHAPLDADAASSLVDVVLAGITRR